MKLENGLCQEFEILYMALPQKISEPDFFSVGPNTPVMPVYSTILFYSIAITAIENIVNTISRDTLEV